jgi:hypothetical protein
VDWRAALAFPKMPFSRSGRFIATITLAVQAKRTDHSFGDDRLWQSAESAKGVECMDDNPLSKLLNGELSEYDFGVTEHGFAPHGRDYRFMIQDSLCIDPGTYELTFTHVVDLKYKTRVGDKFWSISWGDEFTDYARWQASGEPEGYVFGTNWTLAYPGISIVPDNAEAQDWSSRLQRQMYSASLETDRFCISLVFGGLRHQKVSDEVGIMRQVLIPLSPSKVQ